MDIEGVYLLQKVLLTALLLCFAVSAKATAPFASVLTEGKSLFGITDSQRNDGIVYSGFPGRYGMAHRVGVTEWSCLAEPDLTLALPAKYTTSVYIEGGLALIGSISNDANEIDQFGYDVEDTYESDAIFFRIGAGHQFEHLGVFCYGDFTQFFSGFIFYQRTPYSPARLRFNTHMFGYGLETRLFRVLRFRAGYGQYRGNIEVDAEDLSSTESWTTDIDKGSGFHWSVGLIVPVAKDIMLGFEYTHHGYDITPHETQTPAMVDEIHITNWKLGLSLIVNFVVWQ